MSALSEHVQNYLQLRRALGFKLVGEEMLLREFVAFADAAGERTVTTKLALEWASGQRAPAPTICRGGCARSAGSHATCTRLTPRARSRRLSCFPRASTARLRICTARTRSSR